MNIFTDEQEVIFDREMIDRLKTTIIKAENTNIKSHNKTDTEMVKLIKQKIEEEIECYLNQ